MNETSNAVLDEKIRTVQKDFYEYRKQSDRNIDKINKKIEATRTLANEVNYTIRYLKSSIDNMNELNTEFMQMVAKQNERIDKTVADQNKQIKDFINNDKINSSKREFLVSILQVASGIIIAVIGFWTYGKL